MMMIMKMSEREYNSAKINNKPLNSKFFSQDFLVCVCFRKIEVGKMFFTIF